MRTFSSFIRIFVFSILGYFLLDYLGTTGESSIFIEQPWMWVFYGAIMLFYIAGEICVESIQSVLYKTLSSDAKLRYDAKRMEDKANRFKKLKRIYKKLLGSKAIEEEHEIILDHNYDGIKELDNKLPPWWVYGFYGTILFAAIYLIRFEVVKDYNQAEEYAAEVAQAEMDIAEWKKTAKNLVDVTTVTLLTEEEDLRAGKAIFNANCVACHKADGGGGIGPNLTDPYWILGGGIKNVFNTISEGGRDGKGMISWKSELKPAEMAQVASYLLTFQGTSPAEPKAAEGTLWTDPNAEQSDEVIETKSTEEVPNSINEGSTEDLK